MRRKFISSVLRIALALVLSVVTIAPAKFTSFAAGTSGTCGEHVSWSIDGSGVVRISGYGPMANYDSADNISPFYQNDSISSVIIEEGVTSIGGAMFANSRVSSISIPESVVEIGSMALSGCTRLTSIELPAKLEKIGENAFAGCLITKVEMPNTVKEIGARAFSDCPFLASVTVPEGVTTIKESTFSGCPRLTDVKLPSTLKTIDFWAFSQDDGLKKIVIPEGVTTIDQGAFGYCPNLEDVTIPFSVTEISSGAFSTCTSLKEIVIPGNVKRLKNTAFYGCTSLEKVTISDAMETIDAGAFGDCPNLKTIVVRGKAKTASDYQVGGNNDAFLKATFTNERSGQFDDVKPNDYFAAPVAWAVEKGVTKGMTDTSFAPENACTREQAVTFLWRAAGCPEPSSSNMPFADVKPGAYYEKAVLWAVENGVTNGISETEFGVNKTCTRAQIVTFLWRSQGAPEMSGSLAFVDVKPSDFSYQAVIWAGQQNVTKGTSDTAFSPNASCNRGMIVTFLYRSMK